eukprot:TRINITY_DN65102_c0_g1_i1.p1 TRINITY_DN65102_c0_g1~~TRINITY_DN65102_c0_g1_i1.p1  ORF type:complete len:420 (-),score=58.88 TRINITY_DN65102_c0_g1_i1:128-1387(-)
MVIGCRLTLRGLLVFALSTYAVGTGFAALAWGLILQNRFTDLRTNMVGDPEKQFMEECMRDFTGFSKEDPRYREHHKKCIVEVAGRPEYQVLPRIRPTVDEGICDVEVLCSESDPGQSCDSGTPGDPGFRRGEVSQCFELLKQARTEVVATKRRDLEDQAEQQCVRQDRWKGYDHEVRLEYCMHKQYAAGICTSSLQTTCPGGSTCCPVAQIHLDNVDVAKMARRDKFVCRKSPVVGLFCQHLDYREASPVPSPPNAGLPPMCTIDSCPDFEWCRDFADIPGLCISEPCLAYSRSVAFVVACCVLLGAAGALDLLDLLVLFLRKTMHKQKAALELSSCCFKFIGCILISLSGAREFLRDVAAHDCFVGPGSDELAPAANSAMGTLWMIAALSSAGSLCLAPLSIKWGGQLASLPYARIS